ncbi:MAG TPA: response regulator [Polyangiaceae bacterium]|nr:response regulator [Polyangiaceae bacterium]
MQTPRASVLVVDDEPQVLVALEDLLSDEFVVHKADSGEEALRVVRREPEIAVVVTDQRMPEMRGDELLAKLRHKSDATRILLTGYADLSAVARSVNEGGIFAYVTKPWDPQDLHNKVRNAAEQFRLARELAFERRLLHDLMNNVPDGIYFKDRELRFLRANSAFARTTLGAQPTELAGRRLSELLPRSVVVQQIETHEYQLLASGTPVVDAIREHRATDRQYWFSETKAPIRGKQGEIVGLVGIARDVTDRVETQQALIESEQRLRRQSHILKAILDGMGEGVVVADQSGKFLLFNRQAEKLLGRGARSVPAECWAENYGLFLPDQKTLLPVDQNPLLRAMAGDAVSEAEVFVKNETVAGRTLAIVATPLMDPSNEVNGGIALIRDVTEQRRLEKQFLRSQRMDAMGKLAGGVAHDFNNLLAVIQSYAELLLEQLPAGEQMHDDVEQMLLATRRAGNLTKQLLAFGRRQIGQPRALQLNDVVADMNKMLSRIIGEHIRLVTELAPSLGLIRADVVQLEQIIINLTINARDAMPEGGTLTIQTSMTEGEPAFVRLRVSDTGTGMSEETRQRIFEPFFTTKEVGRGTGLGLSTVYGIVHQSGGQISVESELGRGTSFTILLPFVEASDDDRPADTRWPGDENASATILLVEDDAAVRRVTSRILRERGYNVMECEGATQARRWCSELGSTIDLLLTDMVMPEVSGTALAAELCSSYPQMRVLYMSGFPHDGAARDGFINNGKAFIEKPFKPVTLLARVREVLGASHAGGNESGR